MVRLDEALTARGLAPGVKAAQALVLAGRVSVNGRREEKAGSPIADSDRITVLEPERRFVSRGGNKLDAALDEFQIDVRGRVALDVGTSTGGFTDCLLQRGALRVYAVDTGYGRIDQRLRCDPRVVLRERTNARFLDASVIPEAPEVAAGDVSFISLSRILPAIAGVIGAGADLLTLVKPQFEARRNEVPRGGIVRDEAVRERVVGEVARAGESAGLVVRGRMRCPVPGARGNVEFFLWFRKG